MRRREVITILGLTAIWPGTARAQQSRLRPLIAYLSLAPGPSPRSDAFREGLRAIGYLENQNLTLEFRWSAGDIDRARSDAAELVYRKVDVIVTGGPLTTAAAKEATANIPIVMAVDYDPVGAGFVNSLSRPGGNITGLTAQNPELSGKRLELAKELVPRAAVIAVLWNPAEPNAVSFFEETQTAATSLGLAMQSHQLHRPEELEGIFRSLKQVGADALVVLTDSITLYHRAALAKLATEYRLPSIYSERLFAEVGGLLSYGANDRHLHRQAALYVQKILNGANPADLPVQQPTQFELILNLRTAKALDLTIPQTLLARADEVID